MFNYQTVFVLAFLQASSTSSFPEYRAPRTRILLYRSLFLSLLKLRRSQALFRVLPQADVLVIAIVFGHTALNISDSFSNCRAWIFFPGPPGQLFFPVSQDPAERGVYLLIIPSEDTTISISFIECRMFSLYFRVDTSFSSISAGTRPYCQMKPTGCRTRQLTPAYSVIHEIIFQILRASKHLPERNYHPVYYPKPYKRAEQDDRAIIMARAFLR